MSEVRETDLAKIYRKKQQIKDLEAEIADLYERMGDLDPDSYVAGDFILKVRENRRFNAAQAKRALSPAEYEKILKTVPDAKIARAVLDEDTFAMTQKVVGVVREVVRVEDEDA